ncbi:hypothetical protein M378DRAFT_181394 [Amanita muscaria Koide BX008]|uniref:Uncharacterized protein n=1 Tax=Amanita muscaria (strain Koide BX008) TaxID=946122 RepID=A0A0C2SVP1_AMAMK|nr:hypothetical protein M378DRAFT_181394 [Amanita muscaria Koide BX008]
MANNSRKVKLLLGKQPESSSRATGQAGAMHLWQASTAHFAPVHCPGKSKILAALDCQEEEESSETDVFFEGPKGANSGSDESDDGAGDNIQEKTCKVKIRYNFTLYSAAEMKKPKGQRTGKASSTELSSDMPWIDFYEELKMYAAKLYSKPILDNLHNFQINYTIPRVSTDLLALEECR